MILVASGYKGVVSGAALALKILAITGDVAESKRSVTEAAELAYHGIKFDVICAQGNFSYTVHTRRYCEATKDNITCFAFR
ncbi:unnamed protein product [Gongylonema pulchrum]|uniref:Ground-like domain-containing protein n=1 Tax=Gongylonema pulchrum TaxID=637853 RepID=A0A183CW06_9BILA|nr:unnamed protein product [Gongylonema pulchrum]